MHGDHETQHRRLRGPARQNIRLEGSHLGHQMKTTTMSQQFFSSLLPNNNHTPPLNEQQEQIVADKLSNDNLPMSYKIIPYDDI